MKAKTKTAARVRKQLRRHVKLTLVPHGANQYRPHLIRRTGLAVVLLLVIGLQGVYGLMTGGTVLGVNQPISAEELLTLTNQRRAEAGLTSVKANAELSKAAFMKANDMFEHQYWAHTSPSGVTPWQWFDKAGYNYAYAGENLAKDFGSASSVMTAWMGSTDHRANILNEHYTQVGFAVVDGTLDGRPTVLVVALYGEPVRALAGAAAAQPTPTTTAPAVRDSVPFWTRIVVAAEAFTPAAIIGLIVLTLAS
ncbi:MAG TPA: CAP domain-containing protein, partial [Candidatus Saccharimonadales bacterium]|nr:CAP domain-containing protein [Candidatus Saccharimonadales bacterium]